MSSGATVRLEVEEGLLKLPGMLSQMMGGAPPGAAPADAVPGGAAPNDMAPR